LHCDGEIQVWRETAFEVMYVFVFGSKTDWSGAA
jgi:hypothetical protein